MLLPENYLNEMKELLKEDFPLYLASLNKPSFNALRVNTLKISVDDFLKISPFKLEKIKWSNDSFYVNDPNVSKHPYYYAGLYYLQEPSALSPAEILPIKEDDIVLDACSAPGGKATKLACKLNNTGLLVSNDLSFSRQAATMRNIQRFGIKNAYVIAEDLVKLVDYYPNYFTKILVDAPCSGEGMFRKDPSLIKSWEKHDSSYYCDIQFDILKASYQLLSPDGMMVYSTCTFSKKENEDNVERLLDTYSDLELVPIDNPFFTKGLDKKHYTARLYPHKLDGEGHFVALFQKKGKTEKKK